MILFTLLPSERKMLREMASKSQIRMSDSLFVASNFTQKTYEESSESR